MRDYCTGFDSNKHNGCCKVHDNQYGCNGRWMFPGLTRQEADQQLRECLKGNGMHPLLAGAIYYGLQWTPYFAFIWWIWRGGQDYKAVQWLTKRIRRA